MIGNNKKENKMLAIVDLNKYLNYDIDIEKIRHLDGHSISIMSKDEAVKFIEMDEDCEVSQLIKIFRWDVFDYVSISNSDDLRLYHFKKEWVEINPLFLSSRKT